MIHLTNGDCVRGTLRQAGLPGDILICADPLHDGPCREGLSAAEFDRVRAKHLADDDDGRRKEIEDAFAERDGAIAGAAAEDEVVLWFEHDLFDQLNLLWVFDRLRTHAVSMERVRLIVIGEYPGVRPFHGLGQLTASQLAELFPGRVPVTPSQIEHAATAWAAVCAPTPDVLGDLANQPNAPLEFVPAALGRLLEELPGRVDGLSRIERQGLAAFAGGASTWQTAFQVQATQEPAVFLGDSSFLRAMRTLALGDVPLLVDLDGAPRVTAAGRAVIEGAADHATLNGLDRWVGGVHCEGRDPRWRWDSARGVLVDGRDARA